MASAINERVSPVLLPANRPGQFYRGGANITALRGIADDREFGPEDWVASTTVRFGENESGLSVLPDGRMLRDAVAQDSESWLGAEHVAAFGDSTALLVKLLDANQRLPVHCHPSNAFAQRHLGSPMGKTEAWIVVATAGTTPSVYLGFREDVSAAAVQRWVSTQDSSAMLGALNKISVRPGDTFYVPAGTPHAIGSGVFIVELQQPTDYSITLEWQGFLDDAGKAFLGVAEETALLALNRDGLNETELSSLITRTAGIAGSRIPLLPECANEFFLADRLHPNDGIELAPSFGVLIVLDGAGEIRCDNGDRLSLRKGDTAAIPYCAGGLRLEGELTAVRCRPPAPTNSS